MADIRQIRTHDVVLSPGRRDGAPLAGPPVPSRRDEISEEFAARAWVVEVLLASDSQPEIVVFAVAEDTADEAHRAVLRYPGILASDRRMTKRGLAPAEIAGLKLRPGGVRPYDRISQGTDNQ